MPIGPVAAGVPSDTNASGTARQATPSETATTDGAIVVGDKNKNKNWHNNKNWNNKNWNNKRVVVVGPTTNGTSGLITGPSSVGWRSERC